MTPLQPGDRVAHNISLTRLLGQGGMGQVWVGQHETLDTEVAVKFISADLAERDPSLVGRFKREASLAAKIKSPHVVQMLDYGLMNGVVPYIVMEKLEGETLGKYLARERTLGLRNLALLLSQSGKALDMAHQRGVIHRDIKPDNLFLLDSGYEIFVKVLDFGIAKSTKVTAQPTLVTDSSTVAGTPQFMSPEQLLSTKNVTHQTDLWAMGVIAYCALTGRCPFDGETLAGLTLAICMEPFAPPSGVVAGLGPAVDAWFERALAKDPAERFADGATLSGAFEQAIEAPLAGAEHGTLPLARTVADPRRVGFAQPVPAAAGHAPPTRAGHPPPPDAPLAELSDRGATEMGIGTASGAGQPPAQQVSAPARTLLSTGAEPAFAPSAQPQTFHGSATSTRAPKRAGRVGFVVAGVVLLAMGGVGLWQLGVVAGRNSAVSAPATIPSVTPALSHTAASVSRGPAEPAGESSDTSALASASASPMMSASAATADALAVPTAQTVGVVRESPRAAPPPPPPPRKPADCITRPFDRDANGDFIPREDCL